MTPFRPVPKPPPREKKARARMRPRSAKQAALYAGRGVQTRQEGEGEGEGEAPVEGRAGLVARLLAAHPLCQMGDRVQAWCLASAESGQRAFRCSRTSTEVHEVLRRSAGGSIVDDRNCLATCRACHRWVHLNPTVSRGLGLLASRYA